MSGTVTALHEGTRAAPDWADRSPCLVALGVFAPHAAAVTRHVWVAAVPLQWDVVPSGTDPMMGTTYPKSATRDWTVVYRLYDRNWRHLKSGASMPGR